MSWSQRRRLPEPPAPEPPLPAELSPCLPRVVRLQPTCRLRSGPGAARWPPRRPRSLLRSPRCRTSATSRKRSGRSSWPSWIARRKKRRRSSPCSSKDRAPSSRLSPSAPLARAAPLPGAIAASPPVRLGSGATAAAGVARLGVVRAAGGCVCRGGRAPSERAWPRVGGQLRTRPFPRAPAPRAARAPGLRLNPGLRAPHFLSRRPRAQAGTGARNPIWPCTGAPGADPAAGAQARSPARPPARGASSRRGPSARAGPSPGRRALPTTAAGRQEGGGGGGAGQGPKRRGVSGGCAAAAIFQPLPPGGCSHPVLALPASLPATAPPARSPARQVLLCLLTVEPARICVFAEGGRRESSSQTVVSRRRNFSTRELSRLSFPRLGDPLSP